MKTLKVEDKYGCENKILLSKYASAYPYQICEDIEYKGKLSCNQNKTWCVFIPDKTGSYEVICESDTELSMAIYNETKTEYINNAFIEKKKQIKLASTLKNSHNYYLEIKCRTLHESDIEYSLIIKYIIEPASSYFKYQWGLLNKVSGLDINILPVWQYTMGKKIKIGIADTGINHRHSALTRNINNELSYNFVHDLHETYPENEENTESSAVNGHGTHAAGIISVIHSENNNIVGISPEVDLISLKILGSKIENYPIYNEASVAFIRAIQYAKQCGIRIINCSFTGNKPSKEEKDAMVGAKDILFIIAAGNKGINLEKKPQYPACYYIENSIVVAAIDKYGELYPTSNYGGPTDIAAPGCKIISTYQKDRYMYANATSVAAPFVSAVCSLVWSVNEKLTPIDVKRRIVKESSVTKLESLKNKVISGGLLNAYKAVIVSEDNKRLY